MDFRKLEKIGLIIDVVVLLGIPLLVVMGLEAWWILSVPYKLTSVEVIVYAFPISLPAIAYFLVILLILQDRSKPIVVEHWYTKEINKEWEKIKNLPIGQLQKKISV